MLLSRFAENAYWMGRYMERAESLARLLMVTEAFAADQESEEAWAPILSVFSDAEDFKSRGKPINALNVARYYITDAANPNSVTFAVHMVKENARALRHLLSTESWRQVYIFESELSALKKTRFPLSKLSKVCANIENGCYTLRGVLDATGYRDEVWRFLRMGEALERADQVTRLIDIKYFRFDRDDEDEAAPPDVAWWNTLLRSASAYHAFQRRHSFTADPADAAKFLICDPYLPLSVTSAADTAVYQINRLEKDFGITPGPEVKEAATALLADLESPPARLNGRPLHRFIDKVQRGIILLANALHERYFSPA